MKRVLMAGPVGCGKTTLCQRLAGVDIAYKKTQALEVIQKTIDTPGEYLERRSLLHALIVTSTEADVVLFLQPAPSERFLFSPGAARMFPVPVAGVVSQIDGATEEERQRAAAWLELAGASPIFPVSALTGEGMENLLKFLE